MALHASELSNILEQSISKYYANLNIDEIGTVLTIGDGIARVYGLGSIADSTIITNQIYLLFIFTKIKESVIRGEKKLIFLRRAA